MFNINKSQAKEKYTPIIENAFPQLTKGVRRGTDDLLEWLPVYLANHKRAETPKKNALLEAASLSNTPGMGAVSYPGAGSAIGPDRFGQAAGSGDRPSSLSLAIQIAAQTIGLEILPTIPMETPMIMHHFKDTIYAGGTISGTETPFLIKLSLTKAEQSNLQVGEAYDLVIDLDGSGPETKTNKMRYVGRSRIEGYAIFQILGREITYSGGKVSVADVFGDSGVTQVELNYATGSSLDLADSSPGYVKTLEDHVSGFSGKFGLENPANADAFDVNKPYDRATGEATSSRSLGMQFTSKSISAATWNVDIAMTREQIHDARQFGYDMIAQAKAELANETTQDMNKHILDFVFELGVLNHKQIFDTEGMHFNVNWNVDTSGPVNFDLGYSRNGTEESISATTPKAKVTTGGETLGTAQRRILDQVLFAANEISHRGRYGAGDTAVVSTHVATVLQSIRGFQAYPMANTVNQAAGSLRPLGSIAGVEFYTDPNMKLDDKRVCVFRKGDGSTPGAVMFPYVLGDTVEIIAEGTMGPKIQLKSRYALDTVGHHPQTNYVTFTIATENESDSLLR